MNIFIGEWNFLRKIQSEISNLPCVINTPPKSYVSTSSNLGWGLDLPQSSNIMYLVSFLYGKITNKQYDSIVLDEKS